MSINIFDYLFFRSAIRKPTRRVRVYLANKERALDFVYARVALYNEIYNFNFNRISVKNQKTRWGSCSEKGNLNFNYRIVLLPIEMADYIIVHELCHLGELNHSPKFWNLVARAMPNYLEIRKRLFFLRHFW
ncbi:M48 family metallopeptidase [Patescibacteria group bacterium]|nr:M48 family metallopeptidase [Patescibacteria group bacterium]MBU2579595.1 M48 family metallopeptidase [Patescibacteria group bacterium]